MKTGNKRTFLLTAVVFSILSPDLLVIAQAQSKSFGDQLVDSLVFIAPFAIMVVGGSLIIYNTLPFVAKLSLKMYDQYV